MKPKEKRILEKGMILVDKNNDDIILINKCIRTASGPENDYSKPLGRAVIKYSKLDNIDVGRHVKIYSKFEETILQEYRFATITEVEKVKRVIAVMLNKLVRNSERECQIALGLKEKETSIVEKGMILTGKQFESSTIIVHSVSNRLVKYVDVNRIGLGINVDSIIREAADGVIYVHYRGSTSYEIERVINKLRSMLNTLTPFSEKSRVKDNWYYPENFENGSYFATRDDSTILKDIANLIPIPMPTPNPPITEENKWKRDTVNYYHSQKGRYLGLQL